MYDFSDDLLTSTLEQLPTPSLPTLGAALGVRVPKLHSFSGWAGRRLTRLGYTHERLRVHGTPTYLWRKKHA